nr:right-handed parallel beta-helix repeat-containing protein [Chthoniobacterales bacterium]
CRVVYNNIDRYDPGWHAGGAKLIPRFNHGTIRHNEFAHNLGPGLWLDSACDGNVIDGNLCHDNEGPGIMVETSRDNLVMNNICYANRNSLSGPYRDSKGALAEKEISKNRIGPLRLLKLYHAGDGRGIYVSSAPATKVIYNTCYLNEAEGICVEGPPREAGSEKMTTRDETVANNISVFNKGSQLTLHQPAPGETPTASDHNILFAVGAVLAKYGWQGPVAMSLPEWQKTSSQDAHSLDTDPRFAMAAMDDFRVFPNSPALGAGTAIPEADHDFFGHPRGKEKTTIGACEQPAENYPEPLWQSLSITIASDRR